MTCVLARVTQYFHEAGMDNDYSIRTWMGMQPNNWRVSPTVLMLLCTSFMKLSSAVSVEPMGDSCL